MQTSERDEIQSAETDDRLGSLKYRKALAKTAFTKAKNQVYRLIDVDYVDERHRKRVKEACTELTVKQEQLMEIFEALVEVYSNRTDRQNNMKTIEEIERMESEFSKAINRAQTYLDNNSTNVLSGVRPSEGNVEQTSQSGKRHQSIDPKQSGLVQHNMSIAEIDAEIERQTELLQEELSQQIKAIEGQFQKEYVRMKEQERAVKLRFHKPAVKSEYHTQKKSVKCEVESTTSSVGEKYHSTPKPKSMATSSEIGANMWKQLKRVSIPVFNGDKSNYESWKAAFTACVDNAPVTPEYKLLQLRECLSGEALRTIQNLGHSGTAYEAAKQRLERKFGGERRKIALNLEQLERFKPMQDENLRELEKITDILDMVIVNLEEAERDEELGNGVLYVTLQKKLPETLLVRYHRWVFENRKTESVLTLRDWMLQEVEFLTTASETIHGCIARPDWKKKKNQQTFFGEGNKSESKACPTCEGRHAVWSCKKFKEMKPWERWNTAKQFRLCFRCLNRNHIGSSCKATRVCGKDGCQKTHHELLHTTFYLSGSNDNLLKKSTLPPLKTDTREIKTMCSATQTDPKTETKNEANFNESNARSHSTRNQVSKDRGEFIALRTVPVVLKNGNREVKVNALLDDGSTKSYINADVAAELGLQGMIQKATVNVLNGQVKTFVTMPVDFELKSLDGQVIHNVSAFTTEKVTGDMEVVDWNQYASKWKHLREITFPNIDRTTTVDLLIGVDHADLLYSKQEVRGDVGEPIARLTPLGWTCIGPPTKSMMSSHTNFNYTYFLQNGLKSVNVDEILQKFWEVEEKPSRDDKILTTEDQAAIEKATNSIQYNDGRYQIGIPWKEDPSSLPNNHEMAFKRLRNTEKRLNRDPELKEAYSNVIENYIKKRYIRKVPEEETAPNNVWYLPHFPVLRPDKPTTKTRIVFDASAKFNEKSLNDMMFPGPKLQRELNNVLLRF